MISMIIIEYCPIPIVTAWRICMFCTHSSQDNVWRCQLVMLVMIGSTIGNLPLCDVKSLQIYLSYIPPGPWQQWQRNNNTFIVVVYE